MTEEMKNELIDFLKKNLSLEIVLHEGNYIEGRLYLGKEEISFTDSYMVYSNPYSYGGY